MTGSQPFTITKEVQSKRTKPLLQLHHICNCLTLLLAFSFPIEQNNKKWTEEQT